MNAKTERMEMRLDQETIGRLYVPIAAGIVVSLLQVGLDRRLASGTQPEAIPSNRTSPKASAFRVEGSTTV